MKYIKLFEELSRSDWYQDLLTRDRFLDDFDFRMVLNEEVLKQIASNFGEEIVKYLDNVNYASPVYVRSVQPDKSLESIVDGVERVYTTTLQPLFACARNDIGLKT